MLSEDKVLGSLIVSFHPAPAALKLTVVDRIGPGMVEIDGGGMSNGVANGDGRRKPILVLINPK